jgi:hypothetical protein
MNGVCNNGGLTARVRSGSLCWVGGSGDDDGDGGNGGNAGVGWVGRVPGGSESARPSTQTICSLTDILRKRVAPVCHALSRTFSSTWLPIELGLSKVRNGQPSITTPYFRVICSSKFLYIIRFAWFPVIAPRGLVSNLLGIQH